MGAAVAPTLPALERGGGRVRAPRGRGAAGHSVRVWFCFFMCFVVCVCNLAPFFGVFVHVVMTTTPSHTTPFLSKHTRTIPL